MANAEHSANFERAREGRGFVVLFTLTIFLSASLLFFVQPLFSKLVLPVIGGAPAVWTTAMLFFQTVLICGYLYAHLLVKYCPIRWQLGIHLVFWIVGLVFLPLAIPEGWAFDPAGSITLQTLGLFALGVGVPFAVLSANAPLLQAWYRASGAPSGDDRVDPCPDGLPVDCRTYFRRDRDWEGLGDWVRRIRHVLDGHCLGLGHPSCRDAADEGRCPRYQGAD